MGLFSQVLADCTSNHSSHDFPSGNKWFPSRLLDLKSDASTSSNFKHGNVRLVETNEIGLGLGQDDTASYLTLSHRWGLTAESMMTLTGDKLEDYKETGIDFQQLPRRFKDAVALTRRLKVRYLWIDSLW